MRAAVVVASALAMGVAAVLRFRREGRERDARAWASATDRLSSPPTEARA